MQATLTTPSGAKVRTQTQRRFVLLRERTVDGKSTATVVKRSDAAQTLATFRKREGWRHPSGSLVLMDTRTGQVVTP
jgi:hypothetical protein